MFEHFYHEIFRKTIIAFGNVFNNIEIHHTNSSDDTVSIIKVPLAYGPVQKFLARIEQDPAAKRPVKITLPRMSFEFIGLNYDSGRKVSTTQSFIAGSGKKMYMPVPYNMQFELNIISKLNDDALQIVEQILPYFQPNFNLTVNLVEPINEKKDIPIVLDNVTFTDEYEGDYTNRRSLIYTLRFTAKTYLFGPVPSSSSGIIKRVTLDYMSGVDSNNKRREVRYSVTPRASKDYDNDSTTVITTDVNETTKYITVSDASTISAGTRIYLDSEQMYVESKDNNNLVVIRGYEETQIEGHVSGTSVNLITESDDDLISFGDDFGFNDEVSFYQDFREYSPSQNLDL